MECKHDHHTDEARKNVEAHIEEYGCHVVLVQGGNLPDFCYSIGLHQRFDCPEIICFGLKTELMQIMINHACSLIKEGETLVAGKLYESFLEGHNIQFIPVDKAYYPDYLGYAGWFYNNSFDFPALQIVYPDLQGFFPWEESFDPKWKFRQPLLDRNTEFKFYEERNTCVFTTSQVLEGQPILNAYHNEDGAWQFHTGGYPDLADAKLVCLEEITKLDPSINQVAYMDYGWKAYRDSIEDAWQFEEHPDEEEEEIEEAAAIEKPRSLFQKLGSWFK